MYVPRVDYHLKALLQPLSLLRRIPIPSKPLNQRESLLLSMLLLFLLFHIFTNKRKSVCQSGILSIFKLPPHPCKVSISKKGHTISQMNGFCFCSFFALKQRLINVTNSDRFLAIDMPISVFIYIINVFQKNINEAVYYL